MSTQAVRNIDLSKQEFDGLSALVFEHTGISLNASKTELVKRRFLPRLKALGLADFASYIDYVEANFESEGTSFCNAITTNLTAFFREPHHFDLIGSTVLPTVLRGGTKARRIRLWSAGCSTGQEAYCMAITLLENLPDIGRHDVKILATDLDENCLATARAGTYPRREFDKVPDEIIKKYFRRAVTSHKGMKTECYEAEPQLKELITFNKLNLMQDWPMKGNFDLIFCRNVFIYFERDTQQQILRRFAALQPSGSFLCLGHSEIMANPGEVGYRLIGKTSYIRN